MNLLRHTYARAAFAAVGIVTFNSACSSTEPKRRPTSIEVVGTLTTGTAGLPLATAPTFSVKDGSGAELGGVPVTITVTTGGGTLAGSPTTTASAGPTSIGTLTLGRVAGPNVITVTVSDLAPLVITVVGVAGPPASIAIVAGNNQSTVGGAQLPQALTAQVRDQFGNGVAGTTVFFSVSSGGGTITPTTATADASGNAVAQWKVGKSVVPQTAIASSANFTAAATATVATNYSVDVRFFGPTPSSEAAVAFTDAAARIRAAVIGDLTDVNIPLSTGNAGVALDGCGVSGVVLNEVVDDVIIYATVTTIDGPGKILASAGPCFVRLATGAACVPAATQCNSFTIVGVMRFDVDDVNNLIASNRLGGVVLHEMMHVVGVGTLWSPRSLLSGKGSTDPRFVGELGISGCSAAGGVQTCATGIPVENIGGSGTADAHWRESVFDSELMTGFSEAPGVPVPMSNMTIQSVADIGYSVNAQAADAYTIPFGVGLTADVTADEQPFDTVVHPILGITPSGIIRKLIIQ